MGTRSRWEAELAWMIGPVSLKSEYATLQLNNLSNGKTSGNFSGNSGYVTLGWFLTGEHEPWKNGLPQAITPKSPFVFGKGGTGAFQILGRYEWLEMDKGLLTQGFVDATQFTNKATGYTFGLTWYPNDVVRFMLNYSRTNFDTIDQGQRDKTGLRGCLHGPFPDSLVIKPLRAFPRKARFFKRGGFPPLCFFPLGPVIRQDHDPSFFTEVSS